MRMGRDGRPIRYMIDSPQPQENGWYRCPWRPFHFEHLPRKSIGPHSKYAEWRLAWHGCKLEGLYSIMYHGKLFASEDGTQASFPTCQVCTFTKIKQDTKLATTSVSCRFVAMVSSGQQCGSFMLTVQTVFLYQILISGCRRQEV